ncbi:hypothetical protein [Frigoribacterium sp. VKM Ac-2530]|nr:hypothetical protein [Frigoribacterium sp. VKM Ac-2530]
MTLPTTEVPPVFPLPARVAQSGTILVIDWLAHLSSVGRRR